MKILVTGSNGFLGKNLTSQLDNIREGRTVFPGLPTGNNLEWFGYDMESDPHLLEEYATNADFVFHLAGVNRPKETSEFMTVNYGLTSRLLDLLRNHGSRAPIMISSSTQATLNNPYGLSKREGEQLLFDYSRKTGVPVLVYRFPNLFGKWSRPYYNSVIATFCHNIAADLPITVNDPSVVMTLAYVDDVVEELLRAAACRATRHGEFCHVPTEYRVKLGEIVRILRKFRASRDDKSIPDQSDPFVKKLYATYLSFLPTDQFSYPLKMNVDDRGSFTEILRTADRGQFSVNISKPHITKGNHWHHTKNEKFLVVSGHGVIRFRKIGSDDVVEYFVSGDKMEVVDIPTGYTHNIENLGDTDMITFMWCNECFDPNRPDTYFKPV